MKQKRLGKRIVAWLLCLAMVLTTINLPAFSLTVKAAEPAIEVSSWESLNNAIRNVNNGDTIKLVGDVIATEADTGINIPSKSFTLDLNGYKIDRNLTSASTSGCVFWIYYGGNSELTIIDSSEAKTGTITGGYSTGNGGAIGLESGNTLKILGGTITGNKAEWYGGGIFADCKNATLILGGTAKVVGNTAKEEGDTEEPSNIHLQNNEVEHFKVGTGDEALVQGTAKIGIRFWLGATIPNTVCDISDEATANCFEADNAGCIAFADNTSGSYKLAIKVHTHDYNGDTSCKATCIECGKRIENGTHNYNGDISCKATCIDCGKRIENGTHNFNGNTSCQATCIDCGSYKTESAHNFDSNDNCTACGIKKVSKKSDGVYVDNQGLEYSLYEGKMQVGVNNADLSDYAELNVIIPEKIVSGELSYDVFMTKDGAFRYCKKLKSIQFAKGITSIPASEFYGCTSLTSITIPDTVTVIGNSVFNGCTSLTSITIPDTVTVIGDSTFYGCTSLTSITIPDTVTVIGNSAFNGCTSLTSITIPDTVTEIGRSAFEKCLSLECIVIPEGVTCIDERCFVGCSSLKNVSLPKGLNSIEFQAFATCRAIKSIVIPDTVTMISGFSFFYCDSLESVTIPSSVKTIKPIVFDHCSKDKLVLDIACTPELRAVPVLDWGDYKTINWIHDYEGQSYSPDADGIHHNQKCKNCEYVNQENHDFLDQDGINDPSIEACASCGVKNINFSGLDSSVVAVDKEYTGSGINPEVTITGLTQDTDYTVEDVTKTEPGEYEIKVTGKGDYAGERIVSWKIIPGEPTLIIPTPTARYKQKLSEIEIVNPEGNVEGTWNWKNPDEVVSAIGESTFVAIFTPADTTKWNVVEKDIIVNVNKASYAPSEEYSKSFIYSGEYIDEIIDLSQFVAEDAGKASYAIADKTFTGTDTVTEAVIDGNNLKFSLAKMDAYAENTSTTISVTVSTANYQDYTKIIKITRSNCDHPEDMIVLEHVILPGCETTGEDIKKCTKCNEVIESGIVVQALGHDYIDGVCSRCGVISLELCKDINVDVTSVLYNETAQTPEVKVTYKGTELVEGTDYVLSVDSETVIGTYELIIEGTGDYRDTIKKNWSILPAKGLYCAAIPDQVYTGKAIKPKMDVYSDGVLLTVGKDYTITYGKYNTNVATKDAVSKGKNVAPSVTITGKGNYSDKKVLTFNIVPCSIDTAAVNNIVVAKTKSAIKINPVVTFDGKKLKLGTDYVVSTTTSADDAVTSYTEANVYNLYVVGKNNYSGAIPFTFTITGKTLANKVTVAKIENQKYDGGNQVKPVPTITYKIGGKSTDVSSHFDVTYDNNTEIGTATVTITAKDSSEMFAGSKTITFKIVGKSIAGAKLGTDGKEKIPVAVYNGNAYEPELNLYVGDDRLTKNVDYIVTYTKNVNNGTATANVVGKGKYTGSKKFTYKISKYDATTDSSSLIKVNGADASVVDISVNYEKGGVLPKPVVTFGGNELKEKADYTLSYANNKAVAAKDAMKNGKSIAPTMTITFKGNLSGKKTVKFTITNKDIKEGKITVADKAVSTKANAWKQTVVTIVDTNGKKLVAGTDYSKTFGYYSDPDCINEITADTLAADTPVYVKVYGIKNYDGTDIVGSYRISKNNLSKVSASIDPQTYTGKEICPEASDIKVWVGSGKTKTYLSAGKDYIVVSGSYTKNTNKGTATVTIIGKGDYYGTKVVKYTIGAKKFLWWEL